MGKRRPGFSLQLSFPGGEWVLGYVKLGNLGASSQRHRDENPQSRPACNLTSDTGII